MARTSLSDPLDIAHTPCGSGLIGMTLCPGKTGPALQGEAWARDLEADLEVIVAWRPGVVVTLMETHEFDLLGVAGLGEAVRRRGIEWLNLPIADVSTPDAAFERAWRVFGRWLGAKLRAGGRVLLHCRGGLGRAGLVAARLLVEAGAPPAEAIANVRAARPGAIETAAQTSFVRGLTVRDADPARADRVLGCLLGGAVGDAFGREVEFNRFHEIVGRFGPRGLTEAVFHDGRLIVSDDTQMTLFTADGLARALADDPRAGPEAITLSVRRAYLDWLKTQEHRRPCEGASGLLAHAALWVRRAPGATCLSGLKAGGEGTRETPINNSKGCGGVMRVAPVGLVARWSGDEVFDLAGRTAALTHGHPSGWLSAAALAAMIHDLAGGKCLDDALRGARARLDSCSRGGETLAALEGAVALAAEGRTDHPAAIRQLGEGWVGEEALAIALYAVLVAGSFREAVIIGANHDGDSDSTASIAGQIWGAAHGLAGVPAEWIARLDVLDAVGETGGRLIKPQSA